MDVTARVRAQGTWSNRQLLRVKKRYTLCNVKPEPYQKDMVWES